MLIKANSVTFSAKETTAPRFWRDETLPFIEARSIQDGRKVCYARHAHETFSIGAITGGHSTYLNGKVRERVGAGAVVVINPEDVHACNPIDDQPWSYHMLYVDVPWLVDLQHELGFSQSFDFRAFSTTSPIANQEVDRRELPDQHTVAISCVDTHTRHGCQPRFRIEPLHRCAGDHRRTFRCRLRSEPPIVDG
jgi:hypothetical protein